jgi:hypothetical protein
MASHNPGKAKLRDLSRVPPTFDDWVDLVGAFGKGEHPIATAILGAELVEHQLERLLRSRFRHQDDKRWRA